MNRVSEPRIPVARRLPMCGMDEDAKEGSYRRLNVKYNLDISGLTLELQEGNNGREENSRKIFHVHENFLLHMVRLIRAGDRLDV